MNRQSITAALLAAATFSFAGIAVAADQPGPATKPPASMSGMGDMSKHHGMGGMKDAEGGMGGGDMKGMMGMMGMMNSCQSMMDKAKTSGSAMTPQLPPGNEKLEFQMHAEMMQKMGEIAAKYAERIKEPK